MLSSRPLLLIAALPAETRALRAAAMAARAFLPGVRAAWHGSRHGLEIWVAGTGMGVERAARVSGAAIEGVRPGLVVSTGFAGALRDGLVPGDVVLASETRAGAEAVASDAGCSALIREASAAAGLRLEQGPIWTADEVITSSASKRELASRTGAIAVEMEGIGIGIAARRAGVPFVAVRTVLDPVDATIPDGLLDGNGRLRPLCLLARVARDPGLVRTLASLAAASRAAGTALGRLHAAALRALSERR